VFFPVGILPQLVERILNALQKYWNLIKNKAKIKKAPFGAFFILSI